jgi:hypothetical protein
VRLPDLENSESDLYLAGTNPIHNKKPKKAKVEEDEDTKAFKAKQQAGTFIDP